MTKQRRTFSIDEDIDDRFDSEDHTNASAVVNNLLREYLAAGKAPEAAMNQRLAEIENELDHKRQERAMIDSEIDQLERKRDDIADKLRNRERSTHKAVDKVVALIENGEMPRDELTTENLGVTTQAENAGLTPERFIERVNAELGAEVPDDEE